MICRGPFQPFQLCDSVSRGCAGTGQHTVCWGPSVTAPCSGLGIYYWRLLIQPFRQWKGPWIFYSFKANPSCLAVFGMEELMNEGVTHADPPVPKARPSHRWAGAGWGSAACSPHRHPVTQQWALVAVPGTLVSPASLLRRLLSVLASVFWESEGCCVKSGEQARRLNAGMCLSGKTAGTSPKTLILNT